MPVRVSHGAVHYYMPENNEDNHRVVFHAISGTATDETSRDDSKSKLVSAEDCLRSVGASI